MSKYKKVSDLFIEMKKDSISFAIVLNEYGSTAGMITMEDIIEEIPSSCKIYKRKVSQYICPSRYWYIAKRFWWGKYIFPFAFSLIYIILQIYGIWFRLFGQYDLAISMAGHSNDLAINGYNIIRSKKKIAWLHGRLIEYMCISYGNERAYSKIKNLVCLNDADNNICYNFNRHLRKCLNIKKYQTYL